MYEDIYEDWFDEDQGWTDFDEDYEDEDEDEGWTDFDEDDDEGE